MVLLSAAALPLFYLLAGQAALFYLLLVVIYYCYGTLLSVFASTCADFYGTRHMGVNYGLLFSAWGVAGIVGPVIAGRVFDASGDYELAFYVAAALSVVALAALMLAKAAAGAGAGFLIEHLEGADDYGIEQQHGRYRRHRRRPRRPSLRFTQRWIPDSWVVCMLLTVAAILLAMFGAEASLNESVLAWGNGMWALLELWMQFSIAMIAAHACVSSRPVFRFLDWLAGLPDPKRPVQAIALIGAYGWLPAI